MFIVSGEHPCTGILPRSFDPCKREFISKTKPWNFVLVPCCGLWAVVKASSVLLYQVFFCVHFAVAEYGLEGPCWLQDGSKDKLALARANTPSLLPP